MSKMLSLTFAIALVFVSISTTMANSDLGLAVNNSTWWTVSSSATAPIDTYFYKNDCPRVGSSYVVDKWSFYKCQCTSYVASKLNSRGVAFNNTYGQPRGYRWSDANKWIAAAGRANIPVRNYPLVGSVVVFNYGHVGIVESVVNSGNTWGSMVISEYNYTAYRYGYRTINNNSSGRVSGFLWF